MSSCSCVKRACGVWRWLLAALFNDISGSALVSVISVALVSVISVDSSLPLAASCLRSATDTCEPTVPRKRAMVSLCGTQCTGTLSTAVISSSTLTSPESAAGPAGVRAATMRLGPWLLSRIPTLPSTSATSALCDMVLTKTLDGFSLDSQR